VKPVRQYNRRQPSIASKEKEINLQKQKDKEKKQADVAKRKAERERYNTKSIFIDDQDDYVPPASPVFELSDDDDEVKVMDSTPLITITTNTNTNSTSIAPTSEITNNNSTTTVVTAVTAAATPVVELFDAQQRRNLETFLKSKCTKILLENFMQTQFPDLYAMQKYNTKSDYANAFIGEKYVSDVYARCYKHNKFSIPELQQTTPNNTTTTSTATKQ
jgi:hypothetical protein